MQNVNVHEAKTHLSKLLAQVLAGEEIIINKSGKPIAKLVAVRAENASKRKAGLLKGKINISADFDAPLPKGLLLKFEG
jgi:prevent-host-death family protein